MERFSQDVSEKLDHYVYFLIDPRNGHTFYIGMGQGDRVFHHVTGALTPDDGETSGTIKRALIQEILRNKLEPIHVIHRHGMDRKSAIEVEAALIDATPGLTNEVRGHGSKRGPARVEQLNECYESEFEGFNLHEIPNPDKPVIVIKITDKGLKPVEGDTYEAARSSWRMSKERWRVINAASHFVLAVHKARCVGVYEVAPNKWTLDTRSPEDKPRYMFEGESANKEVCDRYMRKRFLNKEGEPDRGMRPVRFFGFQW